VEQNISAALSLADRACIINNGQIAGAMTKAELHERPEALHCYPGV
jgi:branched-chain amino acid transport system ATP-binding protein